MGAPLTCGSSVLFAAPSCGRWFFLAAPVCSHGPQGHAPRDCSGHAEDRDHDNQGPQRRTLPAGAAQPRSSKRVTLERLARPTFQTIEERSPLNGVGEVGHLWSDCERGTLGIADVPNVCVIVWRRAMLRDAWHDQRPKGLLRYLC